MITVPGKLVNIVIKDECCCHSHKRQPSGYPELTVVCFAMYKEGPDASGRQERCFLCQILLDIFTNSSSRGVQGESYPTERSRDISAQVVLVAVGGGGMSIYVMDGGFPASKTAVRSWLKLDAVPLPTLKIPLISGWSRKEDNLGDIRPDKIAALFSVGIAFAMSGRADIPSRSSVRTGFEDDTAHVAIVFVRRSVEEPGRPFYGIGPVDSVEIKGMFGIPVHIEGLRDRADSGSS